MKIVTCISNPEQIGYVSALQASCKYYNLELITLVSKVWETNRVKDTLLEEYLVKIDPNDIVLFTDGYDVVFVANEKEILERYQSLNPKGKIIISGDRICSPESNFAKYFPNQTTGYSFINTGGMIGKAKEFLVILDKVSQKAVEDNSIQNKEYQWSNQYLWTKVATANQDLFLVDSYCEIFQTFTNKFVLEQMFEYKNNEPKLSLGEDLYKRKSLISIIDNASKELEIIDDRVYNKVTKTTPIHIHFNTEINKLTMFMEPFVQLIEKVNP
jgi:hypothetical protein